MPRFVILNEAKHLSSMETKEKEGFLSAFGASE